MAARLEGLDDKIAKLNAKLAEIEGLTAEEVRSVGLAVLGQAVRDAPVDTGDLRRSGSLSWGEDVALTATVATKNGKEIPVYDVSGSGQLIARGTGDGDAKLWMAATYRRAQSPSSQSDSVFPTPLSNTNETTSITPRAGGRSSCSRPCRTCRTCCRRQYASGAVRR